MAALWFEINGRLFCVPLYLAGFRKQRRKPLLLLYSQINCCTRRENTLLAEPSADRISVLDNNRIN